MPFGKWSAIGPKTVGGPEDHISGFGGVQLDAISNNGGSWHDGGRADILRLRNRLAWPGVAGVVSDPDDGGLICWTETRCYDFRFASREICFGR